MCWNGILVVLGVLASDSFAQAADNIKVAIAAPVEITTKPGTATSEILVEITWTNTFDRSVTLRTNDVPHFALFDAAGNEVDTFVVDTLPQKGEEQIKPEKSEVLLDPKKSCTWKVKVWVRGLAMEPGRCYMLGDTYGQIAHTVPFVPVVKDGREKLRSRIYEQTVRI